MGVLNGQIRGTGSSMVGWSAPSNVDDHEVRSEMLHQAWKNGCAAAGSLTRAGRVRSVTDACYASTNCFRRLEGEMNADLSCPHCYDFQRAMQTMEEKNGYNKFSNPIRGVDKISWSPSQQGQEIAWRSVEPSDARASMIAPLLPEGLRHSARVLKRSLPHLGVNLMVGAAAEITRDRPGNGGFRLWVYSDAETAEREAVGLAQGMEVKHATYNTGFAGAKVVCDASGANESVLKVNKNELMKATAALLHELNGTMYTGCDLNTTTNDMEALSRECPYVLAAVANESVNPNNATAYGVLGAIESVLEDFKGKTAVVHGCGSVGGTVARELVRAGVRVYTVDAIAAKADIPGATNISKGTSNYVEEFWKLKVDALVPCSISGLISMEVAQNLGCKAIVGATNLPFRSIEVQELVEGSGIVFVPEGVSSAGAVIVDSIEHFDLKAFKEAQPIDIYEFCRHVVLEKTTELLLTAGLRDIVASRATKFISEEYGAPENHDGLKMPIGRTFRFWAQGRGSVISPGAAGTRRALNRDIS
eukprot:758295-Hanusia_phi.AAC.1